MSYCSNCGTQNSDTAKFCSNCGSPMPAKVEKPVVEQKTTTAANSPAVGSKVSLTAQDGKTYTGTIQEVKGDQFRIKYDGFDFEAWLTQAHFTALAVAPAGTTTTHVAESKPQPQPQVQTQAASSLSVGTKVSLVAQDGKAYTGTIEQANGEQYKIKYDGFNFEAWMSKENFTVLPAGSSATTQHQSQPQVQTQAASSLAVGTRVSLVAQDGKAYTGTIQQANGNQYKIRYEGYNFEAWLTPEHFTVLPAGSSATTTTQAVHSQPQTQSHSASSIAVGTKVSLVAQDGKAYTGTIQEANGEQYKIKYDGFNFEAWLTKEHFTVLPAGSSATTTVHTQPQVQSQPTTSGLAIGTKVSLVAQDGKAYTGTIQEVNGNQYKIKYDGFNFEAWLTPEHFTVLSGGTSTTVHAQPQVQSQPQTTGSIAIGTKVSLVAQDGKAYTGTVQDINGLQYKIKYDGFNFEAWLTKEHFTVL